MGFFDDLFGGFFDFNGDGKTDVGEQFIALNMMGAFDDDEDVMTLMMIFKIKQHYKQHIPYCILAVWDVLCFLKRINPHTNNAVWGFLRKDYKSSCHLINPCTSTISTSTGSTNWK